MAATVQRLAPLVLRDPMEPEWFRTRVSPAARWWPQFDEPIYSELVVDVLEGRVPGVQVVPQ